jgi:hypothetical protein
LGRLGSRFSLLLDPVRREVHYGALGMKSQTIGGLVVGLDDGEGRLELLPRCRGRGVDFTMVDQQLTMTSVLYEVYSMHHGVCLRVRIVSPFWPHDVETSIIPAYIVQFEVQTLRRVRTQVRDQDARRTGHLVFGLELPGAEITCRENAMDLVYGVGVAHSYRRRVRDHPQRPAK